jgi:hypothetical protein
MSPLYDFLSFHFLDYANIARSGFQVDLPRRIFESCRRWAPDVNEALVPYLFLAYLTELGLSRLLGALWRSELESDPILRAVAELLDNQGEWLPSRPVPLRFIVR